MNNVEHGSAGRFNPGRPCDLASVGIVETTNNKFIGNATEYVKCSPPVELWYQN